MPCQGFCQAHQPVTNQEFDFSSFENSSNDFWPCDAEGRYLETPGNGFSDPFDMTTYPTSTWVGSEMNGFLTCSIEAPKDLMPNQPQYIEDPSVVTEPPSKDAETRQLVASLEDKFGKLENLQNELKAENEKLWKLVENLQNELKADNEKLCTEVEKNVEKVEDWTTELWQHVARLAEERKMS